VVGPVADEKRTAEGRAEEMPVERRQMVTYGPG
jgi:hypothetical protein